VELLHQLRDSAGDERLRDGRARRRTLSAVIQDAPRQARARRLRRELGELQGYWSGKARARGILSERALKRYLAE